MNVHAKRGTGCHVSLLGLLLLERIFEVASVKTQMVINESKNHFPITFHYPVTSIRIDILFLSTCGFLIKSLCIADSSQSILCFDQSTSRFQERISWRKLEYPSIFNTSWDFFSLYASGIFKKRYNLKISSDFKKEKRKSKLQKEPRNLPTHRFNASALARSSISMAFRRKLPPSSLIFDVLHHPKYVARWMKVEF